MSSYIRVKFNINDEEDKFVLDRLMGYFPDKRNVKIIQILYEYFNNTNKTPTEKQMLNIIENLSKNPYLPPNNMEIVPYNSRVVGASEVTGIDNNPGNSIKNISNKNSLDITDINFDFIQKDIENSNQDVSKDYLKKIYNENTEKF